MSLTQWMDVLLSTEAPALPAAWLMQLGLAVGWALVLASAGVALAAKGSLRSRCWVAGVLAMVLAIWALLPGPLSPHFWLGLAFQMPSLSALLLCGWYLQRELLQGELQVSRLVSRQGSLSASPAAAQAEASGWFWHWKAALLGYVLLGYVLLLDTFAVLPLQIYSWGFSPLLLVVAMVLGLLPWLLRGNACGGPMQWLVPAALLLFAATRLPTGNLWDALLDPWLWLLLQVVWLRQGYRRWRAPNFHVAGRRPG